MPNMGLQPLVLALSPQVLAQKVPRTSPVLAGWSLPQCRHSRLIRLTDVDLTVLPGQSFRIVGHRSTAQMSRQLLEDQLLSARLSECFDHGAHMRDGGGDVRIRVHLVAHINRGLLPPSAIHPE